MARPARFGLLAIAGVLLAACTGVGPSTIASVPPTAASQATPGATPAPTARPRPSLPPGLAIYPRDTPTATTAGLGYIEYIPPGATPAEKRPLLVFLHGSGESGDGTFADLTHLFGAAIPSRLRYGPWPAERPFIVLAPQHDATDAAPCFTADEIDRFLEFAIQLDGVDGTRVYLTGLSCGAIGAWDYLGAHTNSIVAAAVLIAGDGRGAFEQAGCALGLVPIWAFHGQYDSNVALDGSKVPLAELAACKDPKPVDARLTVYEGATHNVWDRTYSGSAGYDVFAWMLGHTHG